MILIALGCISGVNAIGQWKPDDPWNVMGAYVCTTSAATHSERLFLMPDRTWSRASPFSLSALRMQWVEVQTRHFQTRIPYMYKSERIFKIDSGLVQLYELETIEGSFVNGPQPITARWRQIPGLSKPSHVPESPPPTLQAMFLIYRFRFDKDLQQLQQVLSPGSTRLPLLCQKQPLFATDSSSPR